MSLCLMLLDLSLIHICGESPTWIRILHWEYRGHAVYDKRLKEGRSMKRFNQPYKWKAYRPKSRNPESGIPEDAF